MFKAVLCRFKPESVFFFTAHRHHNSEIFVKLKLRTHLKQQFFMICGFSAVALQSNP